MSPVCVMPLSCPAAPEDISNTENHWGRPTHCIPLMGIFLLGVYMKFFFDNILMVSIEMFMLDFPRFPFLGMSMSGQVV